VLVDRLKANAHAVSRAILEPLDARERAEFRRMLRALT
jgi:DNA-binding MarR family transcriptional regulator